MKTIIVAVAAGGALLTGCGGSSSGGQFQQHAPASGDYTQVNVDGDTVDVTKTTLYGYTCLVGVSNYQYGAATIWCDTPTPKETP